MTLLEFRNQVEKVLKEWVSKRNLEVKDIPINVPPREEFGDLSTTLPFKIHKQIGWKPFEIAEEIARELKPVGLIEKIVAEKPGYVNFYCDFRKLAYETVKAVLTKKSEYGKLNVGRGRKIQVEYTSVNPNKALHIGHARNVCLGIALANILTFTGYEVEKINYIDDTGSQMADIMLGFLELGYPMEARDKKFDQYCGDNVYTSVVKKVEENPELREKRLKIAREIEEIGSEVAKKTREIAEKVLMEQLKTCWRLYSYFDALVWESDILGVKLWERAFEELRKSDLVVYEEEGENKGCWVVKLTKIKKYSKETDKVLVRSDGTKTYVAKDIAFAMWKLGLIPSPFKYMEFTVQPNGEKLWTTTLENGVEKDFGSVDLSINVIDVRQRRLQETIKIVLSTIYGEDLKRRYIHYGYEVVSLSRRTVEKYLGFLTDKKFIHMSGRKGLYVNVDVVLDFLKERAKDESLKRGSNLIGEKLEEVAEKIAVASLKYPLISTDLDKIVVFDVDKAMDIAEESGSYILYGYARARKILEKGGEVSLEEFNSELLKTDEERKLIKLVAEFPVRVMNSAEKLNVSSLAKYMFEITLQFNKFYEKCPVLSEVSEIRATRLLLVKCYVQVMEILSKLLAFPLVELM